MEISDRHVVVTGASRGIGAAMAAAFARRGARVTLVARSSDLIDTLAGEIGGRAVAADLFDPVQVDELVPRIEHEIGPIDVLVNNAGMDTTEFFHQLTPASIRSLTELNLAVPLVLTRAALPGMLERNRGHLVYTSSLAGTGGFPGQSVYGATKAGITNFVAALRIELRDTGLRTTVVAPGPVDTPMWDDLERAAGLIPIIGRLRRLHLIPTKSPELIATRTVDAVEAERRHVRTPRRLTANFMLREVPTRITEAVLTGVPTGPTTR